MKALRHLVVAACPTYYGLFSPETPVCAFDAYKFFRHSTFGMKSLTFSQSSISSRDLQARWVPNQAGEPHELCFLLSLAYLEGVGGVHGQVTFGFQLLVVDKAWWGCHIASDLVFALDLSTSEEAGSLLS